MIPQNDNISELCDEEKSYHEWVANNLNYINQNKTCISVMKSLYLAGFAAGYVYKQTRNAEIQLQK